LLIYRVINLNGTNIVTLHSVEIPVKWWAFVYFFSGIPNNGHLSHLVLDHTKYKVIFNINSLMYLYTWYEGSGGVPPPIPNLGTMWVA